MTYKEIDYSSIAYPRKMSANEYLRMKDRQKAIKSEAFWQSICLGMVIFFMIFSVLGGF